MATGAMTKRRLPSLLSRLWRPGLALAAAVIAASATPPSSSPELAYRIAEGHNLNAFLRQGETAAHVVLRSGMEPRLLVAFPAGNSGVGVWFKPLEYPARWTLDKAPQAIAAEGGRLHGVSATVSIGAPRLELKNALLSSIRFLRDYQSTGTYPPEIAAAPRIAGDTIRFRRQRLDGAPGYALTLHILRGTVQGQAILADPTGHIQIAFKALTGDKPLTPMPIDDLLTPQAAADPSARRALAFLSYREKFLAGSWRFDTYFGRDTLMSVRLLMPVLKPLAVESGLDSVLARLSPTGEVAHEEGIGEFAVVANRKAGRQGDAPELDYGMVDDNYMLGPVAADYLLGAGTPRAHAWLAQPLAMVSAPGEQERAGDLLVRNLAYVLHHARPFAREPAYRNLVAIKPGRMTGDWRDSNEGLGGGIYPYDVNAALVPAALTAADRLYRSGLLTPYLTPAERPLFAEAGAMARVWADKAPPLFRTAISAASAREDIVRYARTLGVAPAPAFAAIDGQPVVFHALSLNRDGTPVPVVNSDEGFVLLFGHPSAADLDRYIAAILRPFPAGLMTGAGMVVANAAFAGADTQQNFSPSAYHGAVIWSWQQALLAAGLDRQIARSDLPDPTRARLLTARARLWEVIEATRNLSNSELWSWNWSGGQYRPVPFGAVKSDVDESNAAQLWSTVYLALRPPLGST